MAAPAVVNRDKLRYTTDPWRPLYGKARWQKLRRRIYIRDKYICQQTGALLTETKPHPLSPIADHIIPAHVFWWDGRRELFWDEENIQTVSKKYHDTVKQSIEARARRQRR
ncbi:MAG: HNH endonuclease [Cognatishimia activa]